MTTYISILRGINVSSQKLIKMDALKKMYENLNFKNVKNVCPTRERRFCNR